MNLTKKEPSLLEKVMSATAELPTEQKREILALATGVNVGRKINQEQSA